MIYFFLTIILLIFSGQFHGYNKITSYFGKRISPTTGASSNHSGIDISAKQHSSIYSITNGKVIFTGFKGAGGFTIIVSSPPYEISYCHVSPEFLVYKNKVISQKEKIGNVGPKYIDNVLNNPYKDSTREKHKWCYNRSTSPSYNKKRRHSRQSIRLFLILHIIFFCTSIPI